MSEEEIQGETISHEEISQEVAQPAESEPVQQAEVQQEPKRSKGPEESFADMRRQMREKDEQIARLREAQAAPEEELNLSEEDLTNYGHVKKAVKKGKKEMMEEVKREIRQEMAQATLKLKYTDFDDVVTDENINLLKQKEPELAMSLSQSKDPYAQAVAVYRALKMIGVTEPMKASYPEKDKAVKNSQKPLSVNAVSNQSAIGKVHMCENGLTPELKKQLWKEMEQARKGS